MIGKARKIWLLARPGPCWPVIKLTRGAARRCAPPNDDSGGVIASFAPTAGESRDRGQLNWSYCTHKAQLGGPPGKETNESASRSGAAEDRLAVRSAPHARLCRQLSRPHQHRGGGARDEPGPWPERNAIR